MSLIGVEKYCIEIIHIKDKKCTYNNSCNFNIFVCSEDLNKLSKVADFSFFSTHGVSIFFTSKVNKRFNDYLAFVFTEIVLFNLQSSNKTQENIFLNLLNDKVDLFSLELNKEELFFIA